MEEFKLQRILFTEYYIAANLFTILQVRLRKYGFISVADYYYAADVMDIDKYLDPEEDGIYGWTDLHNAKIVQVTSGAWEIRFPRPLKLVIKVSDIDQLPYSLIDLEFSDKLEARHIQVGIQDRVKRNGSCSVADYYALAGHAHTPKDTIYGWTDLSDSFHYKSKNGWAISLPTPKPLPILDEYVQTITSKKITRDAMDHLVDALRYMATYNELRHTVAEELSRSMEKEILFGTQRKPLDGSIFSHDSVWMGMNDRFKTMCGAKIKEKPVNPIHDGSYNFLDSTYADLAWPYDINIFIRAHEVKLRLDLKDSKYGFLLESIERKIPKADLKYSTFDLVAYTINQMKSKTANSDRHIDLAAYVVKNYAHMVSTYALEAVVVNVDNTPTELRMMVSRKNKNSRMNISYCVKSVSLKDISEESIVRGLLEIKTLLDNDTAASCLSAKIV